MLAATGLRIHKGITTNPLSDRTWTVLLTARKKRILVQTPVAPFLDEFLVEIGYAWSLPTESHPRSHHMAEPTANSPTEARKWVGFPLCRCEEKKHQITHEVDTDERSVYRSRWPVTLQLVLKEREGLNAAKVRKKG